MLTYASVADYLRIKKITDPDAQDAARRTVGDYLRRATSYIDGVCRRRFFPHAHVRQMSIPVRYIDLNNRAMIYDDLPLDMDLLESVSVFTGAAGAVIDTNDTLTSAINRYVTVLTVGDADGTDAVGETRFTVNSFIRIDNEMMRVVSVNTLTNQLTVERRMLSTLAAAHTAGITIYKKPLTALAPGIDFFPLDFNYSPFYGLHLVFPNAWTGTFVGSSYRNQYPQLLIMGLWGYHEQYPEAWVDTLETAPDGDFSDAFSSAFPITGISAEATTLLVADTTGEDAWGLTRFEEGMLLRIDDELLEVNAVLSDTSISVKRGAHGSFAVPHSGGVPILRYAVQQDVIEACITIAATWREADDSKGGRQGVSDMSQGVQISLPEDVVRILTRLQRAMVD